MTAKSVISFVILGLFVSGSFAYAEPDDCVCSDILLPDAMRTIKVGAPTQPATTIETLFFPTFSSTSTMSEAEVGSAKARRTSLATFPWSPAERTSSVSYTNLPKTTRERVVRTRALLENTPPKTLAPYEQDFLKDVQSQRSTKLLTQYLDLLLAADALQRGDYKGAIKATGFLSVSDETLRAGPDAASLQGFYRANEISKMLYLIRAQAELKSQASIKPDDALAYLKLVSYSKEYLPIVGNPTDGLISLLAKSGDAVTENFDNEAFSFASTTEGYIVAHRPKDSIHWSLLTQSEVPKALDQLLGRHVKAASTASTNVIAIIPFGTSVRLISATEAFSVDPQNPSSTYNAFVSKQNKKLVFYVPQFVKKAGHELGRSLARVTGSLSREVYLDDPTSTAVHNAETVSSLSVNDPITLVVPIDLGVIDGKVMQNIRNEVASVGGSIIKFRDPSSWPASTGPTGSVIVISGHSSPELANYVHLLAQAGAFKDGHIIFNSCATPLTAELRNVIIQGGAASLFSFDAAITDRNVYAIVSELVKQRKLKSTIGIVQLILSTVKTLGILGVWQVSDATELHHVKAVA